MPENNNLFNGRNNLGSENFSNGNDGNENVSNILQGANRQKQQEALAHAEGNRGNVGSRIPKSSTSGLGTPSSKSKSSTSTRDASANASAKGRGLRDLKTNPASPIYKAKRKALESAMKTGLAAEIGPTAAKRLVESNAVQKAIDSKLQSGVSLLKNTSPKEVLNDVKNLKENMSDLKSKKDKKSELDEKRKEVTGDFSAEFSGKAIKTILITTPLSFIVIFMVVIVTVLFTDEKTSSMLLGEISSDGMDEVLNIVSQTNTNVGTGSSELYGKAATNIPKEYYDRLKSLGNLYSSNIDCSGNECLDRPEFIYYLKIADIATRYKRKYNVNLEWALITAADLSVDSATEDTMRANAGGYSDSQINDLNSIISIDWDYDYKNISGYQYLDADDSTYDLQILAKNMVKKKTNMSCIDSSGNITQTQSVEDVEDRYLAEGGEKALRCGSGERYTYSSTYTKDLDKFDEFLLEYIDKKVYTKGSGKNKPSSSNSNGCVSTNSSYVWPIGSEETTNSNGIEYALGEPYTKTITSRFGSKESFRVNGHGAIDISGVPGPGIVNVIAARAGTVVYPISDAQTGYADNGSLNNNDGGGYGNHIVIQHDDGNYTLYAHLAKNSIRVRAGDVVDQGQVIAKLGHSGRSTGAHLHFEVREGGNSGAYREDPLKFVDPNNPRPNISVSNSCTSSENKGMADAFVNLALEQKDDSSADGGQKYRDYMIPGIGHYSWCAAFVSWNIYNTEYQGQKLSDIINYKSTWVYEFMNDFYEAGNNNPTSVKQFHYNDNCSTFEGKNGSADTYVPKKGDLIFFDWNNTFRSMPTTQGVVSHIGIVNYVDNGVVHTIEGNTGAGNGRVGENTYQLSSCSVIGFGSWY